MFFEPFLVGSGARSDLKVPVGYGDEDAGGVSDLSVFQADVEFVNDKLPHLVNVVVVALSSHLKSRRIRVFAYLTAVVFEFSLNCFFVFFNYFVLKLTLNVHFLDGLL